MNPLHTQILHDHQDTDSPQVLSKVLVLEDDLGALEEIKKFCKINKLIGLKVTQNRINTVLDSNLDLGAVFIAESYLNNNKNGIEIAIELHRERPELPIFVRREHSSNLSDLPGDLHSIFAGAYETGDEEKLIKLVDTFLFNRHYPNDFVHGVKEISQDALSASFSEMHISCDAPYIVKDKMIHGELLSLMPLESNWCRGFMMMQSNEKSILDVIEANKTHLTPVEPNFRHVNTMLGELSNMIWGAFKTRFASGGSTFNANHRIEVPIIINHDRKYITFGTDDPQLCFKYTLQDTKSKLAPIIIYQKFIFSLNWSPENFSESKASVDDLVDAGELELF